MKSYTIYECELTGKTFRNKNSCLKHETAAHRAAINEQIRIANKERIEQSFADGLTDPSPDFIKWWIKAWNKRYNNVDLEITMVNLRYELMASNTHCAPRNGETNWGGEKPDVPRGYPGLVGRIEGHFIEPLRKCRDWSGYVETLDSFSDLCDDLHGFKNPEDVYCMKGLHSGTGGGGPNSFGYGVTLFIDDFPKLKRHFLKQELKR